MEKYFRISPLTTQKSAQTRHPIARLQVTVTQMPDPRVSGRLVTASQLLVEHEKNCCIQTLHSADQNWVLKWPQKSANKWGTLSASQNVQ